MNLAVVNEAVTEMNGVEHQFTEEEKNFVVQFAFRSGSKEDTISLIEALAHSADKAESDEIMVTYRAKYDMKPAWVNPECDHLCRGAYSTVCSQWIWIPVCGWIYSIKQIIWSFRDGCRFIRICNYNLCRPESWCKEISENPERCA